MACVADEAILINTMSGWMCYSLLSYRGNRADLAGAKISELDDRVEDSRPTPHHPVAPSNLPVARLQAQIATIQTPRRH